MRGFGKFSLDKGGFTLIELLVVISIIVVFSAVLFPNLAQFRNLQKLQDATTQLQSDLRKAQNNAISGTVCTPSNALAFSWQLTLQDNKSYQILANCSAGATSSTSSLNADVSVEKVDFTGCSSITSGFAGLGVSFANISGDRTFLGGTSCTTTESTTSMTITLHLDTDTSKKSKVVVERGGAIYIGQ
jgi:prepilin-type N-terminal cleavage/methylation domain-containing protein